jgi:hypothetical protein
MSNQYHRPTYTSSETHMPFNVTQVRLYGIPGLSSRKKKATDLEILTGKHKSYSIILAKTDRSGGDDDDIINKIKTIMEQGDKNDDTSTYVFIRSLIDRYMLFVGSLDIKPKEATPQSTEGSRLTFSTGIIFGYAYEGHTYDLAKPKIMLIPAQPQVIPRDDSGYDRKSDQGYMVWVVDKLEQCVEFEVNQGFIEQIVLESNLPGRRSPSMYASKMMMGHRVGRPGEP